MPEFEKRGLVPIWPGFGRRGSRTERFARRVSGEIVVPSTEVLHSEDLVFPHVAFPDGVLIVVSPSPFPAKVCTRTSCHLPVEVSIEHSDPSTGETGHMRFCREGRPRWK